MRGRERAKATHALLAALSHPTRREILRAMAHGAPMCPSELAGRLGKPLPLVSYHVRALAECGAVKLICAEQVGGSVQHVYRSSLKLAWAREVLAETDGEAPGVAP